MAKFDALAAYCNEQTFQIFDLPFHKIEALIGEKLPKSAFDPQYWANTSAKSSSVAKAMVQTTYETFLVAGSKRVQFRKRSR